MGHVSSADVERPEVRSAPTDRPPKSNWWIWVVVAVVVLGGVWYFHGGARRDPIRRLRARPEVPAFQQVVSPADRTAWGPAVPVVVTTAVHGDLPVYFDGLGTRLPAYNTRDRSAAAWTAPS